MQAGQAHPPRARSALAAVVAAVVLLAPVGCGTDGDRPADPSPQPTPTAAPAAAVVPESFPLPPDATEATSTGASAAAGEVHTQFEVESSYDRLVSFFDAELANRGWEVINKRAAGDTTRYRIQGHGWTGAVTVFGGRSPVAFLVQLGATETDAR